MSVHICWSRKDETFRRIMKCPTEGKRRRSEGKRRRWVGWAQDWHSTIWTCCGCGDSFSEGERMERPFKCGWRQQAIARAKADWRAYASSTPQKEA